MTCESIHKNGGKRCEQVGCLLVLLRDFRCCLIVEQTAYRLVLSDVPVNIIQKRLGHASLQTTGIYTDTSDENLWRAMEYAKVEGNARGGRKYAHEL